MPEPGNVVILTSHPANAGWWAKATYQLEGPVKFEADGNREGVQPGVLVKDKDEVVAWISAQAHAMVLVRDDRLLSLETVEAPTPAEA